MPNPPVLDCSPAPAPLCAFWNLPSTRNPSRSMSTSSYGSNSCTAKCVYLLQHRSLFRLLNFLVRYLLRKLFCGYLGSTSGSFWLKDRLVAFILPTFALKRTHIRWFLMQFPLGWNYWVSRIGGSCAEKPSLQPRSDCSRLKYVNAIRWRIDCRVHIVHCL